MRANTPGATPPVLDRRRMQRRTTPDRRIRGRKKQPGNQFTPQQHLGWGILQQKTNHAIHTQGTLVHLEPCKQGPRRPRQQRQPRVKPGVLGADQHRPNKTCFTVHPFRHRHPIRLKGRSVQGCPEKHISHFGTRKQTNRRSIRLSLRKSRSCLRLRAENQMNSAITPLGPHNGNIKANRTGSLRAFKKRKNLCPIKGGSAQVYHVPWPN